MFHKAGSNLEVVASDGQVCAMVLQLSLAAHILYSMPKMLAHEQDHHINQGLCAVLAEEVGTPMQHLFLQVTTSFRISLS